MLAGLIFATDDAHDRPDMLAATLPFGGSTLIEFQARLLIGAGAGQIIVVVTRLTPELTGAINRLTRRDVSVDVVRSAREAGEKLHPLARVLVLADGLITTQPVVALLSEEGPDTLLVTADADALPGLERVGQDAIWAGMARIDPQRIAEVAALPADYDFESTLLRVTAQTGADHLLLPGGPARAGHWVERDAVALHARNGEMMTALVVSRVPWVDRYVIAPIARRLLPLIVARAVPGFAITTGAVLALIVGLGLIIWGAPAMGLAAALAAILILSTGEILSWARDEADQARFQRFAGAGGAGLAVLLAGTTLSRAEGNAAGAIAALSLVAMAVLVERGATDRKREIWWSSPAAYPLLLLHFAAFGHVLAGLVLGASYAALSLTAVIDALRAKP